MGNTPDGDVCKSVAKRFLSLAALRVGFRGFGLTKKGGYIGELTRTWKLPYFVRLGTSSWNLGEAALGGFLIGYTDYHVSYILNS